MGKIVVFANQKGGVGKTTSAVNIAAAIGAMGKRVLLVDLDPQGNSSSGVGINKKSMKLSTYDVIINRSSAESCITETDYKNLSIMPSNISLAGAEFELVMADNRDARLRGMLAPVLADYDYVLIDCPPSLGILTINAMSASDGLVIPMQCEYYSLEGLSQLILSVKQIKKRCNPLLSLVGILITMYNGRLNLSVQVMEELQKYYPGKIFETPVTRNVKLSEAPSFGDPVWYYDKYSKGAQQYMEIAKELLEKI